MIAARWLALAFALAGCDKLLGLDPLHPGPTDARADADTTGDGSSDGRLTAGCPADGGPSFGPARLAAEPCRDLAIATTGTAAATCYAEGVPANEIGPVPGPWSALTLVPSRTRSVVQTPRLSPEGREIFAREVDTEDANETIDWYVLQSGTWMLAGQIALGALTSSEYVSAPTRADQQRYMLLSDTSTTFDELGDEGSGMWIDQLEHSISELGVTEIVQPNLSSDGLRLVFVSEGNIFYATRTAVAEPFGQASILLSVAGGAVTPYLADDCSALYFSVVAAPAYQLYRAVGT